MRSLGLGLACALGVEAAAAQASANAAIAAPSPDQLGKPLHQPRLPAYVELNGRIGLIIDARLEVALSGQNLPHAPHLEYSQGTEISRTGFVDPQWRF